MSTEIFISLLIKYFYSMVRLLQRDEQSTIKGPRYVAVLSKPRDSCRLCRSRCHSHRR
ncbi:hypothetical protein KOSB73_140005 [Klebsiella grimontii]|uniref:Uncharacterized protein n=1 Tax=Klebsiella grimontii TaxID=2058152 RepID=A0A285AVN3_9ENTR|nr:hypothetical protein KOSB73_140005 [Klebsiella grimontii]